MKPIIELSFLVLMLVLIISAWQLGGSSGRSAALIETVKTVDTVETVKTGGCCPSKTSPNYWWLTGQPRALAYDWWHRT